MAFLSTRYWILQESNFSTLVVVCLFNETQAQGTYNSEPLKHAAGVFRSP